MKSWLGILIVKIRVIKKFDHPHLVQLGVVQLEVVQMGVVQLGVVQLGVVQMGVDPGE